MLLHTDEHSQLSRQTNQRKLSAKQLILHLESHLACLKVAQVSLHGTAWSHLNKLNRKKGSNTLIPATFLKFIILTWQRNYFQYGTWYNVFQIWLILIQPYFSKSFYLSASFLGYIYHTQHTVFMLEYYSNTRCESKYKTQWSSLLWTQEVSFLFTWKANRLTRIPLYYKSSGSRVLNPSSEIHNFIVQKIYFLYKKEFYKNSFKKVNIHVSLHSINLPKSTVVNDHYGYLRLLDIRPF